MKPYTVLITLNQTLTMVADFSHFCVSQCRQRQHDKAPKVLSSPYRFLACETSQTSRCCEACCRDVSTHNMKTRQRFDSDKAMTPQRTARKHAILARVARDRTKRRFVLLSLSTTGRAKVTEISDHT